MTLKFLYANKIITKVRVTLSITKEEAFWKTITLHYGKSFQ